MVNISKKPFGIYEHQDGYHKPGIWERKSSYPSMASALLALKQMKRKEGVYRTILPNTQTQHKYIKVNEHEQLKKSSR